MVACLVFIAGLCFSAPHVRAEVTYYGLGYSASVTGKGYVVGTGGGDVVITHDFRKAAKACVDNVCLRYFKICEPPVPATKECLYVVTWSGIFPDGGFKVQADDPTAFALAEKEVSVPVEWRGETRRIPLSAMTVQSQRGDIVECPSNLSSSACYPP